MKISLLLQSAPSTQSHDTALRFARASLAAGHQIYRVFFYQDACLVASTLNTPAQDENNNRNEWITLARQHNFELIVCIAAALKRGILDEQEAKRYQKQQFNLELPFELSGLGQLLDAQINSDRLVSFA
jgi:tRNA 2-thiouridine synthesizing protein D